MLTGNSDYIIERKWREAGAKSKVFVDGGAMSSKEFQHLLMNELGFPILQVPSGDPYSARSWPELSFRTILRHIYRQQRFWSSLVDQQPDDQLRASVQLFLGLAEHLYSDEYGQVVSLQKEIKKLEARREQFSDTLSDLARDFLDEDGLTVIITRASLQKSISSLDQKYQTQTAQRTQLIEKAIKSEIVDSQQSHINMLMDKRASMVAVLELNMEVLYKNGDKVEDFLFYNQSLKDELSRFDRVQSANKILSDLKITHCPCCDQTVNSKVTTDNSCFLCHQTINEDGLPDEVAEQRVMFETERLKAELAEAVELLAKAIKQQSDVQTDIKLLNHRLKEIDHELEPARASVSSLVQDSISVIDQNLGGLLERIRQLNRVETALSLKDELDKKISLLLKELDPIYENNRKIALGLDFEERAGWLQDGMNEYLNALNFQRPNTWRHSEVQIYLSRSTVTFRVGNRPWRSVLGGTDSLYFLMAYHYGLMTLRRHEDAHCMGLSIIDIPADFAGENIGDTENFVVQPFIDLLASEDFDHSQFIITGAAFDGLENVNRIHLKKPYTN